ncbi:MAG: ABC transporter permease subunit [Actinobacteria bacterium]|nr:ABC transporter permease subunit [Actinomycetota bacterium]
MVVIALWEWAVVAFEIPQYTLPRPSAIWVSFSGESGDLMHHTWLTAKEALLGYLIGNGIALVLAALMAEFKIVEKSLYPYVLVLRSLPIVALAPLLIIWFGFTIWPIVAASALICFFPTLVNGVEGFKAADTTMLELMRSLNASRTQVFQRVKLPNAMPYIFAALKISVVSSMIGAIVGEWIAADAGLGFLTIQANNFVDTLLLFRAIIAMAVLALSWFLLVVIIEKRVLKWQTSS